MDPRIGFEIRAGRSFDFISSSGADRREEEKRSNPASDSRMERRGPAITPKGVRRPSPGVNLNRASTFYIHSVPSGSSLPGRE